MHFKNQTFGDYLQSQKFSSYGFGAGYHPWTIENKSTIGFDYKPTSWITAHILAGGGYRYVRVTAGEERNEYQVVDRRDLSIGSTANDRFSGPYNSNGLINYQYYPERFLRRYGSVLVVGYLFGQQAHGNRGPAI